MARKKKDPTTTALAETIYTLLRRVPPGMVTTYGELARAANSKAYRAVGKILHSNPYAPTVPCHRVVMSNGHLGGYAFGIYKKIALLAEEGVHIKNGSVVNFEKTLYRF